MRIALCTNNIEEAFNMLRELRGKKDGAGWDMAKTSEMLEPPKTNKKYVVFRMS